MKTIIFGLKAFPFRMDLNTGPTDEAQKMFYDFFFMALSIVTSISFCFLNNVLFLLLLFYFFSCIIF